MIRAVLIAFLAGMLMGGGVAGYFAIVSAQIENDRLLTLESDTREIRHDFHLGMEMVIDGSPSDSLSMHQVAFRTKSPIRPKLGLTKATRRQPTPCPPGYAD